MKWWGWGDPAKRVGVGPEALAMLRSELGEAEPAERVELEQVVVPAPQAASRRDRRRGRAGGGAGRS